MLYSLCFPKIDDYFCVSFSAFVSFLFACFDAKIYIQCGAFILAVAVFNLVGYASATLKVMRHGKKTRGKAILLCRAGNGIFAMLSSGKIMIGRAMSDREYNCGDVVSIESLVNGSTVKDFR